MDNTEFLLQEIEGLEKSLKEANDRIKALEKAEPIKDPDIPDNINKAMKDIYQWMRTESYGAIITDFTDHGILKIAVDLENVEPIRIDLSEVLKND